MSIKDWHSDDQPREKLLKFGASALTDAEILAIFLRTGTKQMSAIDLARSLIERFGSLAALLATPEEEVLACHGVGLAKYAQIQASLEMGKRYLASELKSGHMLHNSDAVKAYLSLQLKQENMSQQYKEVFALVCLDESLAMLDYRVLFVGGIDSCAVGIKEILRHAVSQSASKIIIAHNHPNNQVRPSPDDRELTHHLAQACELIDITLLDHIIVSNSETFSFAEHGYAPFST